jgi:hypothetical protein
LEKRPLKAITYLSSNADKIDKYRAFYMAERPLAEENWRF